jgi:hypothetical protein
MDARRNLRLAAESDGGWIHQHVPRSQHIPDHILLCCFGPGLAGARHHRQLSTALQQAGYRGALAQHLIRLSPLLVRESGRRYRLKRCDETPS